VKRLAAVVVLLAARAAAAQDAGTPLPNPLPAPRGEGTGSVLPLPLAGEGWGEGKPPEPTLAGEGKPPEPTPVDGAAPADMTARWATSLYGFAELDAMYDSTQSYGPSANNAALARPGTYAATHGRTQMTANNSLFGFRIGAPAYRRMRATAQVEVDFFGTQPSDATERTAFTFGSLRMRLFAFRLETKFVDLLAGQYHDLFGWGGTGFYPNSVAFLGLPGQIYSRQPQVRVGKTFGGSASAAQVEVAVAAVRPVQRDSEVPDMQAGARVALNALRGASAQGFGQPDIAPCALGVSGVWRRFAVAELLPVPGEPKIAFGWGAAVNAFVPVIPRSSTTDLRNALSLKAEASIGSGISDLYTGLTGGALFPTLPNPGGLTPPPLYRPNIDSGIVTFDADGNLRPIDWWAVVAGVQYHLPIGTGRTWLAANYAHLESKNIVALTPENSRGGVFFRLDYADANVFFTLTPAVHVGLSYQLTRQLFGDHPFGGPNPAAINHRGETGLRLFF